MAEITVHQLGDAAQADNTPATPPHDPAVHTATSPAAIRAWGVVGGGTILVIGALLAVWRTVACWGAGRYGDECTLASGAATGFGLVLAATPLVIVATLVWSRVVRVQTETRRASITRDRHGDPVAVAAVLLRGPSADDARYALATQAELTAAPYRQLPVGLDSLSVGAGAKATQEAVAPALLTGGAATRLVPTREWLDWLNAPLGDPHILVAGKTNSGKSTLAEALLARRVARGDEIIIIDPHYAPVTREGEPTWSQLPAVGGASWAAMATALLRVHAEYERRKTLASAGQLPRGGFPALTIIVDELIEARDVLRSEVERFQSVMGSGARKYSMYLVLLAQSHRIKDIGGSVAKRENFTLVALGNQASDLVHDEALAAEKGALLAGLRSNDRPAAMVYSGTVQLLDRSDLLGARARDLRARARFWQPGYATSAAPAPEQIIELAIRRAKARGWTREQARAAGLRFDNTLWAAIDE